MYGNLFPSSLYCTNTKLLQGYDSIITYFDIHAFDDCQYDTKLSRDLFQ